MIDDPSVLVGRVAPPHPFQDPVRPGLHGQMQVFAELFQAAVTTDEIRLHPSWMGGGETNPVQTFDLVQFLQKLNEGGLAFPNRHPTPVQIDDLAQQRDFPNSLPDQAANLLDNFGYGP